jgi:hypothetical protein
MAVLYVVALIDVSLARIVPLDFPAVGWAAILMMLATMPGFDEVDARQRHQRAKVEVFKTT